MSIIASARQQWLANPRRDLLAGTVVALALIPEAIAFSIIAGVDPAVGLYASFVIAVTIAFVGGRPAMISAATGAMALLMVTLVRDHGLEYLFAASLLCGVFQIVIGLLKLGRYIKFVSRSVMTGFVNSLAILIFLAQMPELIGANWQTFALVGAALIVIYGFPRLTKAVPSPLVAIVLISVFVMMTGLDVRTVGDMGQMPSTLPVFHLPGVPLTWEDLRHHRARCGDPGLRRPSRKPADRQSARRSDRHAVGQGSRDARPGHRQHPVAPVRRHGGVRHDRPIDHQRHLRRARAVVDALGRPVPAVPDPGSARLGGPDPDGRFGRGHDHGVDRHFRLGVYPEAAVHAVPVLTRDDRHNGLPWSPPTTCRRA